MIPAACADRAPAGPPGVPRRIRRSTGLQAYIPTKASVLALFPIPRLKRSACASRLPVFERIDHALALQGRAPPRAPPRSAPEVKAHHHHVAAEEEAEPSHRSPASAQRWKPSSPRSELRTPSWIAGATSASPRRTASWTSSKATTAGRTSLGRLQRELSGGELPGSPPGAPPIAARGSAGFRVKAPPGEARIRPHRGTARQERVLVGEVGIGVPTPRSSVLPSARARAGDWMSCSSWL